MTSQALSEPPEGSTAMRERHKFRAQIWRLALGTLGLFWVAVLLVLMR